MNFTYVENDSAEENLRSIRTDGISNAYIVDSNIKVKCMVHKSSSQYGCIRSAINNAYMLARVKMTEIMKRERS